MQAAWGLWSMGTPGSGAQGAACFLLGGLISARLRACWVWRPLWDWPWCRARKQRQAGCGPGPSPGGARPGHFLQRVTSTRPSTILSQGSRKTEPCTETPGGTRSQGPAEFVRLSGTQTTEVAVSWKGASCLPQARAQEGAVLGTWLGPPQGALAVHVQSIQGERLGMPVLPSASGAAHVRGRQGAGPTLCPGLRHSGSCTPCGNGKFGNSSG